MRWSLLGLMMLAAFAGVGHGEEPSLHVLARAQLQWTDAAWQEGGLVVSGRLTDEATGDGLTTRRVELRAQGVSGDDVRQATTDAQGGFRLFWPLPVGAYRLHAEFKGDTDCQAAAPLEWEVNEQVSGQGSGQSKVNSTTSPRSSGSVGSRGGPARSTVSDPEGAPPEPTGSVIALKWYLTPPVLTSLVLLCIWFGRNAPWRPVRGRPERGKARVPLAVRHSTRSAGSAPGASPALRKTAEGGLNGMVWDTAFDVPVAGAQVVMQADQAARDGLFLTTDAEGRFRAEAIDPGDYAILVTALGYLEERLEWTLPLRGPGRDVQVGLVPIRAVVLGVLEETVATPERATRAMGSHEEPPEGERMARTPRELAAGVGRALPDLPGRSLSRLTLLVEETYFSSRIAAPEVVSEARRLAEQVKGAPQEPRTTT
jgi:hypothetical protein